MLSKVTFHAFWLIIIIKAMRNWILSEIIRLSPHFNSDEYYIINSTQQSIKNEQQKWLDFIVFYCTRQNYWLNLIYADDILGTNEN